MVNPEFIQSIQELESEARLIVEDGEEQAVALSEAATRELSKTIDRVLEETSPFQAERLEELDHVSSALMGRFKFDVGSYITESELAMIPAEELEQTRLASRLQGTVSSTTSANSNTEIMQCHDLHHWTWELEDVTHHDYRALLQGECLRCGREEEKELVRSAPTLAGRQLQARVSKVRDSEPGAGRCLELSADVVYHLHQLGIPADIRRFKVQERTHHAVVADASKVDTDHDWMLVDASLDQFNPDLPFEAEELELLQPGDDELEAYTPEGVSKFGPGPGFVADTPLFA